MGKNCVFEINWGIWFIFYFTRDTIINFSIINFKIMNFETGPRGASDSRIRESSNAEENKLELILDGKPISGEFSSTFNKFISENTFKNSEGKIRSVKIGGGWRWVGSDVTLACDNIKGKIQKFRIRQYMVGNAENPPMIHALVKAGSVYYDVPLSQLVFPASEQVLVSD
jgi:hypothetical protein